MSRKRKKKNFTAGTPVPPRLLLKQHTGRSAGLTWTGWDFVRVLLLHPPSVVGLSKQDHGRLDTEYNAAENLAQVTRIFHKLLSCLHLGFPSQGMILTQAQMGEKSILSKAENLVCLYITVYFMTV